MFVQTAIPDVLHGSRVYPAGSVIEVPEATGNDLVAKGHATLHTGPASEPQPAAAKPARDATTGKPALERRA